MSVGIVETQRLVVTDTEPLRLVCGAELAHVEVAYETYGVLSPARDNAVLVCHALTGDAHAAGMHAGAAKPGWWDNLIGPGKAVDTDRFFVISTNLLGGCAGTTGPGSTDPATGRAYGLDFPLLDVADLVAVQRRVLDRLGITRLHAAVGGSLGGMQVLQWALEEPERIERAVLVAASARLTPENIALSSVARAAIMEDPDFRGGRYAEHGVSPRHGLKVARMLAHVTYVSDTALRAKFGHRRDSGPGDMRLTADFEVEHYLQHQGTSFLERFDALSYLYLTRPMDYFDPFATVAEREVGTRFRLISFDTDWRFPTAHSLHIRDCLAERGIAVDHTEIASPWGHDSFLLQPPGYHDLVADHLAR
ncbi:homoserine O-acetyltransferase [Nocardioides sp. zg-536]|uniref:Homoserine O-succinyltransferase n=1 Tax=Nocardioides faecalis TaxID=2803858 RepID=A0A939BYW2_9ACTN|nr:homoserine O-acetyltransferase [Nocardioides faecalis]MBM9460390.1 homoserine O-acetyltransferase [Nocardioides faecalis]QVI59784.1 homoserine O-acetyltransferase [Nocardioides faecalis]